MLDVHAPAPLIDLLELFDPLTAARPTRTKLALWQATYSETVGFSLPDGPLIAALGFLPLPPEEPGEDLQEMWFVCAPAIVPHLVAWVKLARLTLARLAQDGRLRIRAHVAAGHRPGQRLCRLLGFAPAGRDGSFEQWEWRGGRV